MMDDKIKLVGISNHDQDMAWILNQWRITEPPEKVDFITMLEIDPLSLIKVFCKMHLLNSELASRWMAMFQRCALAGLRGSLLQEEPIDLDETP